MENLPVNEKQPLFVRALTLILQDKKQTYRSKSNILQKLLLKSMPVLPEPRSDQCQAINALLCSDNLYCPLHQPGVAVAGATNAVNARQNEAVRADLHGTTLSHTTSLRQACDMTYTTIVSEL